MSAAGEARADAAKKALVRALQAVEWLSDAQQAAVEPNGEAAYGRRTQHARQRLLEAVALLDTQRPPDLRAAVGAIARAGAGR